MSLEDTLRWAKHFRMESPYEQAGYQTPDPFGPGKEDVNWRWVQLWEQENPDPRLDPDLTDPDERKAAFEDWYPGLRYEYDRAWVARMFPDFKVWDWKEKDVKAMRKIMNGHVCAVDGRKDDPGCAYGC